MLHQYKASLPSRTYDPTQKIRSNSPSSTETPPRVPNMIVLIVGSTGTPTGSSSHPYVDSDYKQKGISIGENRAEIHIMIGASPTLIMFHPSISPI